MIFGIGTDIVELPRIERLWQRHGLRAAEKILAPSEHAAMAHSADPARLLAKRFAAKEAFAKATGQGLRAPVSLQQIAIVHDALGKPSFEFSPDLSVWLQKRGISRAHLSISDERATIVAFVVLEAD